MVYASQISHQNESGLMAVFRQIKELWYLSADFAFGSDINLCSTFFLMGK